jgi:hypothetical protein
MTETGTASPSAAETPLPSATPEQLPSLKPSASPGQLPLKATPSFPAIHEFDLIGKWSCDTFANWHGEQRYVANGSGRIVLFNALQAPDGKVTIVQRFLLDAAKQRWFTYVAGGDFSAHGGPWHGRYWVFDGVWRGFDGAARLVYTSLGPKAFRRDFQVRDGERWQTSTGETCIRE